jgi:hypothetical protein
MNDRTGWAVIHVEKGILGLCEDKFDADSIADQWFNAEVIPVNGNAWDKIQQALKDAAELDENLRTGLTRRSRGAR